MIHLLLRFSRLAAEVTAEEDLLALLVDTSIDPAAVGADAAAVVRVESDARLRVVVARGLAPRLLAWSQELETLDAELGESLRRDWGETERGVSTFPMVSGRDIYGALVVFSAPGQSLDRARAEIAEGLADLVAVSLDKAVRHAALAQSYAELRASREALARSEKLRALGEMAAGISHDLKNILNPLGLQIELLRRRIEKDPAAAKPVLANMEEAVRAGVDVVERLRAFSRQTPEAEPDAEPVDLGAVLDTASELCGPRVPPGRLTLRRERGEAPPVLARRSELVTAVVNLVFNAIDALVGDSAGTIWLRTGREDGGGYIEVADDGPGMPPEVESRVFEPFFTTKTQGTGLGLAMVYAFVKRHGGRVTLETHPGAGTRFRLWFPAIAAAAAG